jgi:hypothetical protein
MGVEGAESVLTLIFNHLLLDLLRYLPEFILLVA